MTSLEKTAFKDTIRGLARDYENENNFQEAVRESYRAYTPKDCSEELSELLRTIYNTDINETSVQNYTEFK